MKIEYSQEAIEGLLRVVELVECKNPFAARRIAIGLQEGIEKIKLFSEIGLPVRKAPDPKYIRDLYISHYTVRHLITDVVVYILRMWHNKENERNL